MKVRFFQRKEDLVVWVCREEEMVWQLFPTLWNETW